MTINVDLLDRSHRAVLTNPQLYEPRIIAYYPDGQGSVGCFAAFVLTEAGVGLQVNTHTRLATGLDQNGRAVFRTAADLLGINAKEALVGGVFDYRHTVPELTREVERLFAQWRDDPNAGGVLAMVPT